MAHIATRISSFLKQQRINFEVLEHETTSSLLQAARYLNVEENFVIRTLVLKADNELICVVLPLNHLIDFNVLKQVTGKDFEPVAVSSVSPLFLDCEAGTVPPFGMLYEIDTYFDHQILNEDALVFEAGSRNALIKVDSKDFYSLTDSDKWLTLSTPRQLLECHEQQWVPGLEQLTPEHTSHASPGELYLLPAKPELLQKLQAMSLSEKTDKVLLQTLLLQEPIIIEQLQHLSALSFLSCENAPKQGLDLNDVIDRLGVEFCWAMFQGFLVWNSMSLPMDGPLGKTTLMKQACLSAQITHSLVLSCGGIHHVEPVMASQTALLHNVGYLVLSHLFKPEYFLFNRMVQANPAIAIVDIEKQLLAYGQAREIINEKGHADSGMRLLQSWDFDDVFMTVCQQHHNPDYRGNNQEYVHLNMLVNDLLNENGLGEKGNGDAIENNLSVLNIERNFLNNYKESLLKRGLSDVNSS